MIFERMLVIKLLIYFPTMEVSGDQELFGSSNILFVFNIKKNIYIYNGLEQLEGE